MDEAIQKANVLIEALAWIRQFRGKHVVIKLGGSALEERDAVRSFLTDVIFLQSVGLRPILVHGGGKDIDKAMAAAGITPRKVQGRRYTDGATLEIVAQVLAGDICGSIVSEIRQQGGNAIGLSYRSQNCLIGKKLELPSSDGPVDLGFVGEVIDIDRGFLEDVCSAGIIPVIPSVAVDATGQKLNVNADTAAAAIARILKSEKLLFVSDVPGIFLDRHNPATLQSHLTAARCRELIREGIIDAGMVPKVEAALEALQSGVGKVHVVDGRMPHSVLLEIYSDTGVGTEIVL